VRSFDAVVGTLVDRLAPRATFQKLAGRDRIYLYAGNVPRDVHYRRCIGLSLNRWDRRHIRHDVLDRVPLPDGCVDVYQSEDVFEHVEPDRLIPVINDIYRILRPGGLFRWSMPDYRCDILINRSLKNEQGEVVFDPGGGGAYRDGKVVDGGHVWFPKYESVRSIVDRSLFRDVTFYHYYDESGRAVMRPIDYSLGYIQRTPDHDDRVRQPRRPMSIVLDCRKPAAM
jgi:SAM-dependent methyltransferase